MAALSAANMDENGDGVTGQNDPTTAEDDDRQMSITALQDKAWLTARLTKMVAASPGRVCLYVPLSTERAQRCMRSSLLLSTLV